MRKTKKPIVARETTYPRRRLVQHTVFSALAGAGIVLGLTALFVLPEREPPRPEPAIPEIELPESQPPPPFPAEYDRLGVSVGNPQAAVVVREFGDYQCPSCGAFAPQAKRLKESLVADGKVRFVFFDFPLTDVHPNALAAAQAARCAGRLGDYWALHDTLFANQAEWSGAEDPIPLFAGYGADAGLNGDQLSACVREEATLKEVQGSLEFGRAIGITSTPTVIVDNVALRGVPDWNQLLSLINTRLEENDAPKSDAAR